MSTTSTQPTSAASPERLLQNFGSPVELQHVARLSAHGRQAKTHSDAQIAAIAKSIETFGFLVPLLIDERGKVLAGMGRLRAAKLLGLTNVPCIVVGHLTPELKRAFVLAENRLAELGGWDRRILGIELKELEKLDLDFKLDVTGWSSIQIENFTRPVFDHQPDEEPARPVVVVSRRGDVWVVGPHRLVCGDALDGLTYESLMEGERARVCNSDYPFNVKVHGHVTSKSSHREFPMASGEMDDDQFVAFLTTALKTTCAWLVDGALLYIVMDWRHAWHLLTAARTVSLEHINLCVWNKGRGGMGSLYRSQHELFFVFKFGQAPHLNRVQLGRHGRDRCNVWDYPGAIGTAPKGGEERVPHPTPKPPEMLCDALLDCTDRGDIVLDPFGGGGSLLMAAERTGRRARVSELDPGYVDVMIERWQRYTGRQVTLASTGQTFAEVAAERAAQVPAVRIRHRSRPPQIPPPCRIRRRTLASPVPSPTLQSVRPRVRTSNPSVGAEP